MDSILLSLNPLPSYNIATHKKLKELRKTIPKSIILPVKCYLYCTRSRHHFAIGSHLFASSDLFYRLPSGEFKYGDGFDLWVCSSDDQMNGHVFNGKVFGEFICRSIDMYEAEFWDDKTFECIWELCEPSDFAEYGELERYKIVDNSDDHWCNNVLCTLASLSIEELRTYLGVGISNFYGLNISDVKIYDSPLSLSDFIVRSTSGCCNEGKCNGCPYLDRGNGFNVEDDCIAKFNTDEYKPLRRAPQSWCYVERINK